MPYDPDGTLRRLDRFQRFAVCYGVGLFAVIAALLATSVAGVGPLWIPLQPAAPLRSVATSPAPRADTVGPDTRPILARPDAGLIEFPTPTALARAGVPALPDAAAAIPSPTPLATATAMPRPVARQFSVPMTGDRRNLARASDGSLALIPSLEDGFDAPDLDTAQWQVVPWGAGGGASVHGGTATVAIAALRSRYAFTHRAIEARVRFTLGAPLQNLAWSADLNGTTAILIGKLPTDADHLYARVKTADAPDRVVPLPVALEDGAFHTYRIAWGAAQVAFAVDGADRATIPVALDLPMYAWLSAASASPLVADSIRIEEYGTARGTLVATPLDAGERVNWVGVTMRAVTPPGTSVATTTRTSDDGATWSAPAPVGPDGAVGSPPGRSLQIIVALDGAPDATPRLAAIDATALPLPRG